MLAARVGVFRGVLHRARLSKELVAFGAGGVRVENTQPDRGVPAAELVHAIKDLDGASRVKAGPRGELDAELVGLPLVAPGEGAAPQTAKRGHGYEEDESVGGIEGEKKQLERAQSELKVVRLRIVT